MSPEVKAKPIVMENDKEVLLIMSDDADGIAFHTARGFVESKLTEAEFHKIQIARREAAEAEAGSDVEEATTDKGKGKGKGKGK